MLEAQQLNRKYGELYDLVKDELFSMSDTQLSQLLKAYTAKYGKSAGSYAASTMKRWKTGGTRISGQSMARFLDLVPQYVSHDKKYEFVKSVRNRTLQLIKPNRIYMEINGSESFVAVVEKLLAEVSRQGQMCYPSSFTEIQTWITGGDVKLMEDMLTSIETEAIHIRFESILMMLPYFASIAAEISPGYVLTMKLVVPTAVIELRYNARDHRGNRMGNDLDILAAIQKAESEISLHRGEITLHEHLLRNMDAFLTKEQQTRLVEIAAREAIDLDAMRQRMLIQSNASSQDLMMFQELLGKISDGTVATGTFSTASGEIKIERMAPARKRLGCLGAVLIIIVCSAIVGLFIGL